MCSSDLKPQADSDFKFEADRQGSWFSFFRESQAAHILWADSDDGPTRLLRSLGQDIQSLPEFDPSMFLGLPLPRPPPLGPALQGVQVGP